MCRFLIADDDAVLRNMLCTMLRTEPGWTIVGEASDGQQAVEMVRNGDMPDVVILDLNMPRMTGYDVIHELKDLCPPMDVVVYSGEDEAPGRERIHSLASFEYVVKGRPDVLLDKLRSLCALRDRCQSGGVRSIN